MKSKTLILIIPIVILLVLGIGGGIYYFIEYPTDLGIVQSIVGGNTQYLNYEDLTDDEKQFLKPILLEQTSGVTSFKMDLDDERAIYYLQPEKNKYVYVAYDKGISGKICSDTKIKVLTWGAVNTDAPGNLFSINFGIDGGGGDEIQDFEIFYNPAKSCAEFLWEGWGYCQSTESPEGSSIIVKSFAGNVVNDECGYDIKYNDFEKAVYTTYNLLPEFNIFCRDGHEMKYDIFSYTCLNGGEKMKRERFELDFTLNDNVYNYGDDIIISTTFIQEGSQVKAQILKESKIIREAQGIIDSNGKLVLRFDDMDVLGSLNVKLTTNYLGNIFEKSRAVTFVGEPIKYEVTSKTFIQFNTEPVVYLIRMKDIDGIPITLDRITNLIGLALLSNGNIVSTDVEFLGGDLYEVSSLVNGEGTYLGKIQFDFAGSTVQSPEISIDVREVKVNIETAEITPVANLDSTGNYTIRFVDSLGNVIDPDNIEIRVTFPDGVTTDLISFDEFTRIEEGVYEFSYTFNQVEKYTFDIIADKSGLIRGIAKASVSVAGVGDLTAGPPIFKYLIYVVPGFVVAFFIIALIIFLIRRRT